MYEFVFHINQIIRKLEISTWWKYRIEYMMIILFTDYSITIGSFIKMYNYKIILKGFYIFKNNWFLLSETIWDDISMYNDILKKWETLCKGNMLPN